MENTFFTEHFLFRAFCKATSHTPATITHPAFRNLISQTSHSQHPTFQTSHIPNIPHPQHPTFRISHIPNIPHHEHSTLRTSHNLNIPHSQHTTPYYSTTRVSSSLSINFRIRANQFLKIHSATLMDNSRSKIHVLLLQRLSMFVIGK